MTKKHGGLRPGSGRKPGPCWNGTGQYEVMSKRFAARFTEANWNKLAALAEEHNLSINRTLNQLVEAAAHPAAGGGAAKE